MGPPTHGTPPTGRHPRDATHGTPPTGPHPPIRPPWGRAGTLRASSTSTGATRRRAYRAARVQTRPMSSTRPRRVPGGASSRRRQSTRSYRPTWTSSSRAALSMVTTSQGCARRCIQGDIPPTSGPYPRHPTRGTTLYLAPSLGTHTVCNPGLARPPSPSHPHPPTCRDRSSSRPPSCGRPTGSMSARSRAGRGCTRSSTSRSTSCSGSTSRRTTRAGGLRVSTRRCSSRTRAYDRTRRATVCSSLERERSCPAASTAGPGQSVSLASAITTWSYPDIPPRPPLEVPRGARADSCALVRLEPPQVRGPVLPPL
jgi:hypothetical protein